MSLQTVARKFRSSLKLVAKEVEKSTNRVSHDELLVISATCVKSEVGMCEYIFYCLLLCRIITDLMMNIIYIYTYIIYIQCLSVDTCSNISCLQRPVTHNIVYGHECVTVSMNTRLLQLKFNTN